MQTIFVHWHGPFLLEEIKNSSCSSGEFPENLLGNGLYAITGKCKHKHHAHLQYIGITKRGYKERFNSKHKLNDVTRKQEIWLGTITTAYGKNTDRDILELAEAMLIYFNDERDSNGNRYLLNERKTENPPDENCTLVSMFFKKTSQVMYNNLPQIVRRLPEILIWNKDHGILMHKPHLSRRRYNY